MSTIEAVEAAFAAWMTAKGFGEHPIPADGDWHSFAFPGEMKEKGSAKLNYGPKSEGVIKDWRNGPKPIAVWKGEKIDFTPEQLTDAQRQKAALAAEKEKKQQWQAAWLRYTAAGPASPDHPYLAKKQIGGTLNHLKMENDLLIVPLYNCITGEFQTI